MLRLMAPFALLAALAIAQQLPPSGQPVPAVDPRTLATIEGVVLGVNRQPLSGASVSLNLDAPQNKRPPQAPWPWYETATDAFGKFSFQGLEPGRYMLNATHAGYYIPFPGLIRTLTVTTGQRMTDVAIELTPEPVLSGKVTDENGDPMPGVTVRPLHIATATNGRLRIGSVGTAAWNYGVQTGADGEYHLTVDADLGGRWYLSFSANPDWGKTAIKPASAKPASVEHASPEPVSTDRGSIQPAAPVSPHDATSAPDQPERDYVTTYYPGVRELSLASGIEAAAGQQMTGLNVQLQKAQVYHVRGRIAGDIPPNLRVTAFDEAGEANALFSGEGPPTRADGTFSIAGLTPGAWTLILRQSTKQAFLGSRTIQVGDSDVEDVVIPVELPVDLSGSVKTLPDPSGATARSVTPGSANPGFVAVAPGSANPPLRDPDPRMRVQLEPLGPRSLAGPIFTRVENDGAFTLKNVPADWYRVDLSMPGALLGNPIPPPGGYVKSVTFDGRECIDSGLDLRGAASSGSQAPPVRAGIFEGSSRLQITVSMTAGQITGTVTNPDAGASPTATVTLMPDGPPTSLYRPELHQRVKTDASGQFVLSNVVPGTYRVYAWERLPNYSRPNEPVAYADAEFLKLFDGVTVTVAENESKQVALTLISAATMDDEGRRHR